MSLRQWLRQFSESQRRRGSSPCRRSVRLQVERLEMRDLLTFGAGVAFPSGPASPFAVATADFNDDGNPDLAVGNFGTPSIPGTATVSVLLGDGTGNFGSPTNFSVGDGVRSVSVGDFNEDGLPDLVTANFNDSSMSVLLNTTKVDIGSETAGPVVASLSFGAAIRLPLAAGAAPFVVAVGDLDNDTHLDLVSADQGRNTVTVFRGDGRGNFTNAGSFTVGSSPRSVAIGDFDGDSRADLVTANFSNNSLTILRSTSSGPGNISFATTAVTGFPNGTRPFSVVVGNFNSDARPDLAVASFANPGGLFLLLNNGSGAFSTITPLASGQQPINVTAGDFNSDGRLDLAVAEFGPSPPGNASDVAVLEGDGNGGFGDPVLYPVGLNPRWVTAGDFNNDDALDLATADSSANTATVLLNQAAARVVSIVINDGDAQRSLVTSVTVTFSAAVTLPANPADAFPLAGPNGPVGLNGVVSLDSQGRTVVRFTFTGPGIVNGSLANGSYRLTVRGDLIHDGRGQAVDGDANGTPGGDAVSDFFRRYGDLDGNGLVEGVVLIHPLAQPRVTYGGELGALLAALNKRQGESGYVAALDANGDGQIDAADLADFRLDRVEVQFE